MFLVEVPTMHTSPLTLSHLLPEGINQLTCKLFLHCWPTVVVGVRLKIKRMGNGSAHSNTVDVQEVLLWNLHIHTQNKSTDWFLLSGNYNYILIDNKIYRNTKPPYMQCWQSSPFYAAAPHTHTRALTLSLSHSLLEWHIPDYTNCLTQPIKNYHFF